MSEVYSIFRITTLANDRAHLYSETNDDDDDGIPDAEVVTWEREMKMSTAKVVAGETRIGLWGHRVTVYLDGEVV